MVKRNEKNNKLIKFGKANLSLNEEGGINASLDVKVGDKTNLRFYHQDFTTPLGNNITSTGVKARYQIFDNGSRDITFSGVTKLQYVASDKTSTGNAIDFSVGSGEMDNGITFGLNLEIDQADYDYTGIDAVTLDYSKNNYAFTGGSNDYNSLSFGLVGKVAGVYVEAEVGQAELDSGVTKDQYGISVAYTSPSNDFTISGSTANRSNDTYKSSVGTLGVSVSGFTVNYQMGEEESSGTALKVENYDVNYQMDATTVGYSKATNADEDVSYLGISYSNDALALGLDAEAEAEDVDAEAEDVGAGSTTIVGIKYAF